MRQFPKGGLIGRTVHLVQTISNLHVPLYAANAGFFIILALFPALVLVLSLLRYTGLQVSSLIEFLGSFIPEALMGTVSELVLSTYENSSAGLVGLSAVTAVWSASKGVYGLLTGLNAVYSVAEDRGFIYTRLISLVYTFALFGVMMLTLTLHVFGSTLLELVPVLDIPFLKALERFLDLRFFLLLFVQSAFFAVMYAFLPNGRNKLRDTIPGALFASSGWLIFSDLFSIYVEKYANLSNIYGSVYAIALSMLWLYCCMSILFYGAALNQYLEDHQ